MQLSHSQAVKFGFPVVPRRGQVVIDTRGQAWQWVEPQGIGELGAWQAILGMVTGGIQSIFGAGQQAKSQREAMQLQAQVRTKELEVQQEGVKRGFKAVTKQSKFQSNALMLAIGGLILVILMGGRKR